MPLGEKKNKVTQLTSMLKTILKLKQIKHMHLPGVMQDNVT